MKTYSSGMRSRVTFAVSMTMDFDYYLLDEIGAVGDGRFKARSKAALDAKKATANYLMVSHAVKQMAKEVDMALWLDGEGHIDLLADPQEALHRYETFA